MARSVRLTSGCDDPVDEGWSAERVARVAGTAFMFATFGVGAVLIANVMLPILARLRRAEVAPELAAQRWLQRAFAAFVRLGEVLRLWEVHTRGIEKLLTPGALVVANHPTLMDVVFLLSFMPQGHCVVKKEAWRNPALRWIVSTAGYIPNDDGEQVVDACVERLRAGESLVLFPEGSRSPRRGLRAFKRGAAHVALRSQCPILPVLIACEPPALKKGQPIWRMPGSKLHFSFEVGDPIYAKDLVEDSDPPGLAARRVNAWLRSYYESRLEDGSE
ncbi:MAG: lysophospholipid acyltransferase family protein [Myxococcota bacterium]